MIQNGEGVYSFSGGNVTYNGVSLGSTATYRTTVDYRINGSCVFEIICKDRIWAPPAKIVFAGDGYYYNIILTLCLFSSSGSLNVQCCTLCSIFQNVLLKTYCHAAVPQLLMIIHHVVM